MEEGKIATAWAGLVRLKKSINVYKNACATWSNTFVSVGQVGINFSSFGEPASRFTSAIERSGIWKKVR
jgi:hypothetical protein